MWDFLNAYAPAISAIAAATSALAAVAVAVLSVGTWKLYDLERRRRKSSVAQTAVQLIRERNKIRRKLDRFGPETIKEGHWDIVRRLSKQKEQWLDEREEAIVQLKREAAIGPRSLAYLDVAHQRIRWAKTLWSELLEGVETKKAWLYEKDRKLVMQELRAIAGAIETAYEFTPSRFKTWEDEAESYEEFLEEARSRNRQQYPRR